MCGGDSGGAKEPKMTQRNIEGPRGASSAHDRGGDLGLADQGGVSVPEDNGRTGEKEDPNGDRVEGRHTA